MTDDTPTARVRVRGIYATAVTRLLLEAGHDVVQASEPIRERFDAEFADGNHEATVATTDDRQGVGIHGDADAVGAVDAELRAGGKGEDDSGRLGRDSFGWDDPAPAGAVFDAAVTETGGSGAICDLGEREGYLPYSESDGYVDVGDVLRVQVRESAPPWADRRPELGTAIHADGGLATLVWGREGTTVDTRDDAAGRELAGMTDLLSATPPDDWGIVWAHAATRAGMDALEAALERAIDRAEALEAALGDEDASVTNDGAATTDASESETGRRAAPAAGRWRWFGRETRFALDEVRRTVSPTMPGHHRTKAGSETASAGVDLAEALCGAEPDDGGESDFPFDVVTRQCGPTEGDVVSIRHGKPDGRAFSLGEGDVTDRGADGTVEVTRTLSGGGTYDALGTPREAGDTAVTKVREGRWWYPTVYRGADREPKGTYVNVCTPVECFPDAIRYIDLHVDVVKRPDGPVERVDDDELDASVAAGNVPEAVAAKARSVATSLERALSD
ncbi:MAG: DUF402 domain-containing protein [Haloquadratum sp.]